MPLAPHSALTAPAGTAPSALRVSTRRMFLSTPHHRYCDLGDPRRKLRHRELRYLPQGHTESREEMGCKLCQCDPKSGLPHPETDPDLQPKTALTTHGGYVNTECTGWGRKVRVPISDGPHSQAQACGTHSLLQEFIPFCRENNGKARR